MKGINLQNSNQLKIFDNNKVIIEANKRKESVLSNLGVDNKITSKVLNQDIKETKDTQDIKETSINKFDVKEVIYFILFILAIGNILLTLFSIQTLISIFLLVLTVYLLLKSKLVKIKQIGLIYLLPKSFQYLLLEKSILDILMDFWHLPGIKPYIKLLINPIIYKYTPEQSIDDVENLDNEIKDNLKTKGLINLISPKFKNLMLPVNPISDNIIPNNINKSNFEAINSSSVIKKQLTNEGENSIQKSYSTKAYTGANFANEKENDKINTKSNVNAIEKDKEKEKVKKMIALDEKLEKRNIDREREFKLNQFNDNPPNLVYYNKAEYEAEYNLKDYKAEKTQKLEIIKESEKENQLNKETDCKSVKTGNSNYYMLNDYVLVPLPEIKEKGDKVFYIAEDPYLGNRMKFKSVVINSTKKLKEEDELIRSKQAFAWDNLHKYNTIQKKISKNVSNIQGLNFIEILKKKITDQLTTKINKPALYKGLSVFGVLMILQMILNRNARKHSINFIKSALGLALSIGASFAFYKYSSKGTLDDKDENNSKNIANDKKIIHSSPFVKTNMKLINKSKRTIDEISVYTNDSN